MRRLDELLGRVSDRAWGWVGPISVALLAFVLRVWNVGYPRTLLFDETYYAKDAWALLRFGYVRDYRPDVDQQIAAGDLTGVFADHPAQIAHPDGGKWLIAAGEQLFGMDAFGWRISAVVVGALTVLVLTRLVRRLTGSTWLGCLAGLLLCLDGMHFVMSRLALLDGFLTFWLVSAIACLVADRDWLRRRLEYNPRLRPLRPWQLLAGVCFGLAIGTKWSGVFVLAAFGVLVVVWEVLARRAARREGGAHHRRTPPSWVTTTLLVGLPAFASLVLVALAAYLATWAGWLAHHELYAQRFGTATVTREAWGPWVDDPSSGLLGQTWDALRSLWHYHLLIFDFHTGDYLASRTHPYQSDAIGWLVLDRPVAVDAHNNLPAAQCGAAADSSCMRVITLLGNPVVWWSGTVALIAAVVAWLRTRDGRWAVPVVGVAATWLPWLRLDDRPIFSFYAVATVPFMIIAIALVISSWHARAATARSRYVVWLGALGLLVATTVAFWWFHPVLTDDLLRYDDWRARMWFTRWI